MQGISEYFRELSIYRILILDQYLTKKERLEMLSSFRDDMIEVVNDTFKFELSRGSVDYNFIML